jgi:glycolate oxidase
VATLATALEQIVGAAHVLTRPPSLLVYRSDGLPGHRAIPSLAVFPGTRHEVVRVVRELAEAGAPFVARGAGTGLSGGALADGIVLLGLHRLKGILAIDAEARTATVEPGVVNATLSKAVAPPTPPHRAPARSGGTSRRTPGVHTASSTG